MASVLLIATRSRDRIPLIRLRPYESQPANYDHESRITAQDAVQETFIKAYRHFSDYRGESSEKTWLTAIAINISRDMLKSAWFRHQSRSIDLDTLPEQPAEFDFPDNTVLTEVMRLPAKYREVILLRYYEGLKLKEIASALGLSDGRVRSRLNKANGLLRDRLKEWFYNEEL